MKIKSILFGAILVLSTFSVGEAFERTFKLPDTFESRREYKLFCQMKWSKDWRMRDYCIERQEKVLKINWFTYTRKEAENIQRYFSFCIISNRQRIKQGIDKNEIYYELWSWSPQATYECLTQIEEADKKKQGDGEEDKVKGEPGPRNFGSSRGGAPEDML